MTAIRGVRWWIVGLLFASTLVNYIDRQAVSVLAPVLREEFGMTATDYSRIVFAFLLGYTLMQAVSGKLMDAVGVYRGFAISVLVWSVAAMAHALAASAVALGAFRFALGLGEAGNWPGAAKAVAEWFPPKERAFATGLFNSGSIIGAVVSPPLIAWIGLEFGWRTAFVATGALGFLLLVAWLVFYRAPEIHPRITAGELVHIRASGAAVEEKGRRSGTTWRGLLGNRQVWGILLVRVFADPVWWFYVFWLPEYLKRAHGFDMGAIARYGWIPFLTAGAGSLVGGAASSALVRRGWSPPSARKVVMAVAAIGMLSGIPAVLAGSASVAIGLISVAAFSYCCWASNILTLPADLFPQNAVGSVMGIGGTGAAIGGMAFTLAIGPIVDHFSYTPVFFCAGVMPVVAATILYAMVREAPDVQ